MNIECLFKRPVLENPLQRTSQHAKSLIYPAAALTYLLYKGKVVESRAGHQQSCPLMGACHAVLQRSLLEATGIILEAAGTESLLPTLHLPANVHLTPLLADDGFRFVGSV